jgi:hypothetical protein
VQFGIFLFSDNILRVQYGGVSWSPAYKVPIGHTVSALFSLSSSGVTLRVIKNGVRSDLNVVLAPAVATVAITGLKIANDATNYTFHGAIGQIVVYPTLLNSSDCELVLSWLSRNALPQWCPVAAPIVCVAGDSIAAGLGIANHNDMWSFSMLNAINSEQLVNMMNSAISGSAVQDMAIVYPDFVLPFYAASRSKNILIAAGATNNMSNGETAASTIARYYNYCDNARDNGFTVIVCTVLPRLSAVSQAFFDSQRALFNTQLRAEWSSRGYKDIADVALVAGMGADGDQNNLANYQDKIHPTELGNALLMPSYRDAVLRRLAA